MPKVSVVMPVYNAESYVRQAIESVLKQTFPDFELIAVDDGSTDRSGDILDQIDDSRLIVVHQSNAGSAAARNIALRSARGEFVAFLDADDEWLPHKLETQLQQFESQPSVDILYSNCYMMNSKGKTVCEYGTRWYDVPDRVALMFVNDFIPMLTLMVRRRCFDEVGLFDESIRMMEDFKMKMRLVSQYSLGYCAEPLAKYRVFPAQKSAQRRWFEEMFYLTDRLILQYPSLASVRGKRIAMAHRGYGRLCFGAGDLAEARSHYWAALCHEPFQWAPYIFLLMAWPGLSLCFNHIRKWRRRLIGKDFD